MNYQNELKAISLPSEQWAQVPNEPLYYASSEGRIVCFRFNKCKFCKQSIDSKGYLRLGINGKTQRGHRLVISAFKGISDLCIDHINGNKKDNRLVNLEYVTNRENTQRYYILNDGTCKYMGVSWKKTAKKYESNICFKGKKLHLGYYELETHAAAAYQSALSIVNDSELSDEARTEKIKQIKNRKPLIL